MTYFPERVLTEELVKAKKLLAQALTILDEEGEAEAAYLTCVALDQLIGAPSLLEQWYLLTGLDPKGSA